MVRKFAALGDPTRFAVVEELMRRGEAPAGDLVAQSGLTAPAVSRHLKVLREAGLISQRVDGTRRIYSVDPEAMQAISDWTAAHRAFWEAGLDRLAVALGEDKENG